MGNFRRGPLRALGRFIGLAASYALLINLILAGLLGAQSVAATSGGAAFELCLSGADGSPLHPGDGAEHAGKVHCVLCVGGNAIAGASASPAVFDVRFQVTDVSLKPARTDGGLSSVDHRSTSPRGPPQQA